jgi:hypothetical protein
MTVLQTLSAPLDDERRRDHVYSGDLLVFKDVSPLVELCTTADALIRAAFGELDPELAQFHLERDDYVARVDSLQTQFRKHPEIRRLFRASLEYVGVNVACTCWDALYLRVLPHGESHASRRTAKLGFHRDTWSSNIYSQTNWWTPIYPITSDRTIVFCPGYWTRPVANTSSSWDLEVIRAQRRDPSHKLPALPVVPEPSEPVDMASELRTVVEPGDLLCFSGAHLHASVPNLSGVARFSVEARTVDVEDVMLGRGAPNVDGQAPHTALEWFHSVEDGAPLPALIGRAKQVGTLSAPREAGRGAF